MRQWGLAFASIKFRLARIEIVVNTFGPLSGVPKMEQAESSPKGPDKVLVVDDDETTRQALDRALSRAGYEVTSAEDGEKGLQLAIEVNPTVILSDLRMARLDGHTLLRRVVDQRLDAAVVIMSAQGEMSDVIEVLRNGAVDYLEKPWSPSDLLGAVARAAEVHDHRRSTRQLKAAIGMAEKYNARPADPPPGNRPPPPVPPFPLDLMSVMRDFEARCIAAALERTAGNKTAAADLLGLGRTTLVEKLRRMAGGETS